MKKIINWTFGSVFRTFGRIICYLLVGYILSIILSNNNISIYDLLGIETVSAKGLAGWGAYEVNYDVALNYHFYNCSGDNNCSTDVTLSQEGMSKCFNSYACVVVPYMTNSSNITTSSNYGTIITTAGDIIYNPGYVYGVSMYVCTNKNIGGINNLTPIVTDAATGNQAPVTFNLIDYVSPISGGTISTDVLDDGGPDFNYCYNFRYAFSVSARASWVGFRVKPSSNITGLNYNVFGLSHYNYGVDSEILRNLATQNDLVEMTNDIVDATNENTDAVNGINDTINDDDVSDATDDAGNFFSGFSTNTHGLTGIITAPLNAIQSLTSSTCSPLVLPLPYVNRNLTLPCMRSIYDTNFGSFMVIYDAITLGIISYWVMVRIFALVKDFKNPEHDEIEVMDL